MTLKVCAHGLEDIDICMIIVKLFTFKNLDLMYVFFADAPRDKSSIRVQHIKNDCLTMDKENVSRAIIVVKNGMVMAPNAKQVCLITQLS